MFTKKIQVSFSIKDLDVNKATKKVSTKDETSADITRIQTTSGAVSSSAISKKESKFSLRSNNGFVTSLAEADNHIDSNVKINTRANVNNVFVGISPDKPAKGAPSLPKSQRFNRPKSATSNLRKIESTQQKEYPHWHTFGKCDLDVLNMELDASISDYRKAEWREKAAVPPLHPIKNKAMSPTSSDVPCRRNRPAMNTNGPILHNDSQSNQNKGNANRQRWNIQTVDDSDENRFIPSQAENRRAQSAFRNEFFANNGIIDHGNVIKERSLSSFN
jgi:hypothetical protein